MPYALDLIQAMCESYVSFSLAVMNKSYQIDNHYPKHPLFKTALTMTAVPVISRQPLQALTVFTDASSKTKMAGFVWKENGIWQSERFVCDTSVQILELKAVIAVLNRWNIQDLNIVTDSLYVAGVVQRIERALLGHVNNPPFFRLLSTYEILLIIARIGFLSCI